MTQAACRDPRVGTSTQRATERRRQILEKSRDLFILKGFQGTGVAQISCASNIKVGQIYRDYASKEDIIAAIAFRDLSRLLDEYGLERAIKVDDGTAIRQWILSFATCDHDIDCYRLIPEIMAEAARNPRIARLREELSSAARSALSNALAAWAPGIERAAARSQLVELIMTLVSGLSVSIIMEAQHGRDHRLLCARLETIVGRELDVVRPPEPPSRASRAQARSI